MDSISALFCYRKLLKISLAVLHCRTRVRTAPAVSVNKEFEAEFL